MNGQQATIDKLKAVVARLRQEWADDPNIRSIGWGLKRKQGALQDTLGIIFYVKRKLVSPRAIDVAGSRPIPAVIDDFPTDIEEANPGLESAGQRDEKEFDPLIGGVATSNADGHIYWFNGAGTLGMLVHDAADGAPMALSNWHVWADGGDEGDDIIQPGHPTGGDHVEGVAKVLACGPLLTSLIEWEAPSPLTAGLYGGAAAAALAACASDYRDPTRRGQDQTPTNPGELTTGESVSMRIEYPQLPLPGVAFKTNVKWRYERQTTDRVLTHLVDETRVNTQFLLGKLVVTDKPGYKPGETVKLTAAIWDYQPRPCDGYHVVAHLISHARPNVALRVVLQPSVCPRTFPQRPPDQGEGGLVCVTFDDWKVGQYANTGTFGWLAYVATGQPVRVVDWFAPFHAVQIPTQPLLLLHEPASRVTARVAQFTNTPVTLRAYNSGGGLLDEQVAPAVQGVVHELVLKAEGIVRVVAAGGGGEGLLISYCIEPVAEGFATGVTALVATGIRAETPAVKIEGERIKAQRCCFTGSVQLPPDEKPGKWDVHLTVQNVNPVPDGTPPEQAATTIGGHVLSSHASADVLGCTVIMLLDHAFDVI